jgi:hypothetical protein
MASIIDQQPFTQHTGNGVTTVFAYEFQLLAASDLVVSIDDVVVPPSQFVLVGVGNQSGGTVTFNTAPSNHADVLLSRELLLERDTDYQERGDLLSATLDNDFNRIWQVLQGQRASINGVLRFPYPEVSQELPDAAARANTQLLFDSNGQAYVAAPISGSVADVLLQLINTTDPTKGDAMVGVKQPFPGAVGRTQHDKNAEWVSVTDFTGTDTEKVQAAHNASLYVRYPAGGLTLTGKIQVRVGTHMYGDSAGSTVIYLAGDMAGTEDAVFEVIVTAANFLTQQGGIVVRDIFINGNSNFGHGFLLRNVRFPIFENVWIFNFEGAAILFDYVEEGFFNFLNINGCGRSNGGGANVTANTLYGQLTFDRTAAVFASSNNNFLRFNDCTLANGNCSGDVMIKGGTPSRIYFTRTQSEISGGSIGNRDWLIANGQGGIFFLHNNDVVNYRNFIDQGQYVEVHSSGNRVTNSTKFYQGQNGTAALISIGDTSDGALDTTSIGPISCFGSGFGAVNHQYINNVSMIGCGMASYVNSNVGSDPKLTLIGNGVGGDMTVNSTNEKRVVSDNRVGGVFGLAHDYQVNAAAALTLPQNATGVTVNGNTAITSISAAGCAGRLVALMFSGSPIVTSGGNLNLGGNFVATPGDVLLIVSDGTTWFRAAVGAVN